jgi:ribosomal protein S18 acetylase RimI-like enzyme
MTSIIEIDNDNIHYLQNFISNECPATFRYFKTRNIDIIKNHVITIILLVDGLSIGYAHIDYDNKYWFGICILENYQGKGFGRQMMEYLFNHQKVKNLQEVILSVDKINDKAIRLYKTFNFSIIEEHDKFYIMKKPTTVI